MKPVIVTISLPCEEEDGSTSVTKVTIEGASEASAFGVRALILDALMDSIAKTMGVSDDI